LQGEVLSEEIAPFISVQTTSPGINVTFKINKQQANVTESGTGVMVVDEGTMSKTKTVFKAKTQN